MKKDTYYLKRMIEMNKECESFIRLDKDWILSFNNMEELGKAVKGKMMSKLFELDEDNKRLLKAINEREQ